MAEEKIVSLMEYRGKVLCATENFIFDITDGKREVLFSSQAAKETTMGKEYKLVEITTTQQDAVADKGE